MGELESVDRERERERGREREGERETSKQSTTPLRPATNNKMAYQPNGSSRLQCRSPQASIDHYDGTHGPFRSSMCFIKKCIYAMYCLDSCVPSKCEPVYWIAVLVLLSASAPSTTCCSYAHQILACALFLVKEQTTLRPLDQHLQQLSLPPACLSSVSFPPSQVSNR